MIKVYSELFTLLTRKERQRFFVILGLVLMTSVLEAASILSILPFLQVISEPDLIKKNTYYAIAYAWGGFETDRSFMITFGVAVFLVTVLGLILKALAVWVLTRFATMRSYRISAQLLAHYLGQPYVWFLGRHTADLGTSILAEVHQMVSSVLLPALRIIPDTLTAALMAVALLWFEPEIAIGAVVLLGGAYGAIYAVSRHFMRRLGEIRLEANKLRFHTVQETFGGFKEIKLMGLEERFLTRFRHAAYRIAESQTSSQVLQQLPRFALEALAFGGMILLLLTLIIRNDGNLTTLIPTLGLVTTIGMRIIPSLQQIYSKVATIRYNSPALERIHQELRDRSKSAQAPAAFDRPQSIEPLGLDCQIELRDVHYTYPGTKQSALNGLSMTIKANTTVGIVGGTGAGKTTLIDIILGLLTLQQGELLVDGTLIGEKNLRAWQTTIGYVPQQIFLSDSTVAENIAFGETTESLDRTRVERAARIAALHEFVVNELPKGYDTTVGERGTRLSGGQRQRIGIARALYNDPDVLILDEATSALDNLTEKAVMDAVDALAGSKTVIMIAHRLTTVKTCDRIFLLRKGAVAAEGRYQELVENDEEFRAMAES